VTNGGPDILFLLVFLIIGLVKKLALKSYPMARQMRIL
jgi:hypothetical protein